MASVSFHSTTQLKPSLHVGVIAKIQLNQKLHFVPELLFVNRGFDFPSKLEIDYNYIEIPCQLSYEVSKKIDIQAGINFANKVTPELAMRSFFYGLSAGGSVQVNNRLFFSIRFNRDFVPLFDESSGWSLFYSTGFLINNNRSKILANHTSKI